MAGSTSSTTSTRSRARLGTRTRGAWGPTRRSFSRTKSSARGAPRAGDARWHRGDRPEWHARVLELGGRGDHGLDPGRSSEAWLRVDRPASRRGTRAPARKVDRAPVVEGPGRPRDLHGRLLHRLDGATAAPRRA